MPTLHRENMFGGRAPPAPAGELTALPTPQNPYLDIRGPLLREVRRREGKGRKEREKGERKGRKRRGGDGEGLAMAPPTTELFGHVTKSDARMDHSRALRAVISGGVLPADRTVMEANH